MIERKPTKLVHRDQNGHPPFKFTQLFDSEASWDKDQLGDALHWIRQFIYLFYGLICGAIPMVGGIWIVIFFAVSSAIIYSYYALILKVDEEDFGGHGTLLMEGIFASFTLFLLGALLTPKIDGITVVVTKPSWNIGLHHCQSCGYIST